MNKTVKKKIKAKIRLLLIEDNKILRSGITNLIKETPELSDYADYWKKEYDFWIERNDAMVKNILNFSKEFKGKKILVMCGFAHKTILLSELILKSEEYNIDVKSLSDL